MGGILLQKTQWSRCTIWDRGNVFASFHHYEVHYTQRKWAGRREGLLDLWGKHWSLPLSASVQCVCALNAMAGWMDYTYCCRGAASLVPNIFLTDEYVTPGTISLVEPFLLIFVVSTCYVWLFLKDLIWGLKLFSVERPKNFLNEHLLYCIDAKE